MSSELSTLSLTVTQYGLWYRSDYQRNLALFIKELSFRLPLGMSIYKPYHSSTGDFRVNNEPWATGGDPVSIVSNYILPLVGQGGLIVTALIGIYTVISKLIEREKDTEITIEANGKKLTIKGKNLPSARSLINTIFPEYNLDVIKPAPSWINELARRAKSNEPDAELSLYLDENEILSSDELDIGY